MARITDYEQDEDKPFGVGTFRLDDGSEYYLDDPQRASQFLDEWEKEREEKKAKESSDFVTQYRDESRDIASSTLPPTKRQQYDNAVRRLAEGPNAPQKMPGRLDPNTFEPRRRYVSGPGGGVEMSQAEGDDSLSSQPGESVSRTAPPAPEPEPPPLSQEEVERQAAAQRGAAIDALVPRRTGGVSRDQLLARQRQGVPVEKSVTREGGMPVEVYNQQFQDRLGAYNAESDVLARHQAEDDQAAARRQEEARAEIIGMRQRNDLQQRDLQRKDTQYQQDRKWLDDGVERFYESNRPDGSRYFRERGVFGNIASAIAQFMGAYASIVTGAPNFANQILDKKIERDIDDQMEDFRRGKIKRDSQLSRMAERGMSLEQMRAGLRLQQEKVIEKEAKAAALAEGSRESKQAYEAMMAGRQTKFVEAENKFRTEALGKETTQSEVVHPSGGRELTPLERLEYGNKLRSGLVERDYLDRGGAPAERAEERADKRADAQGKKDTARQERVTEYGNKRKEIEPAAAQVQSAREELYAIQKKFGHLPGVGTWDLLGPNTPLGERRQRFLEAFGVEEAEAAGRVQQLLSSIESNSLKAAKGSQSEGDVAREAKAMRGPNQSEEQVLSGVDSVAGLSGTALDDLNAAYLDVVPEFEERKKREKLERYERSKGRKALEDEGKDL
jgi:hypothetical protein